jgi:hypothetical protein
MGRGRRPSWLSMVTVLSSLLGAVSWSHDVRARYTEPIECLFEFRFSCLAHSPGVCSSSKKLVFCVGVHHHILLASRQRLLRVHY